MLTKFAADRKQEIHDYYYENGYAIVEGLLELSKIDYFLEIYTKIKSNKWFLFYAQDIHIHTPVKLSPEGFIINSMMNPVELLLNPQFSGAIKDCLIDEAVSEVLKALSGNPKHTLWQSMFFDKSTGTVAHQDHYYLDTVPGGGNIAAWYALEDIHEEAGCFFVVPGSHKNDVITEEGNVRQMFEDHDNFLMKTQELISKFNYQRLPCPLKKGDVLFWHPYTIHGSFENKNPQYSRKSFTAHYFPSQAQIKNRPLGKMRSSKNPSILLWDNDWKQFVKNLKMHFDFLSEKLRGVDAVLDMRSRSYKE